MSARTTSAVETSAIAGSSRVIVAGSGRSGTTWVLDVLAQANGLRTVFEPLKACVGPAVADLAYQFVPPDAEAPVLRDLFDRIWAGKLHSIWTDFRVVPERLVPTIRAVYDPSEARRLANRYARLWQGVLRYRREGRQGTAVKLIRGNLLLDWLARHYDVPVLFVVRHPCAVIESKIRLDGRTRQWGGDAVADWSPWRALRRYMANAHVRETYVERILAGRPLERLSEAEAHALWWCVENVPLLSGDGDARIVPVFYEWLASDPVAWPRVCGRLGLQAPTGADSLSRPSQQASREFLAQSAGPGGAQVGWQQRLNDTTRDAIANVLRTFDVQIYDVDDALPRPERAPHFLGQAA